MLGTSLWKLSAGLGPSSLETGYSEILSFQAPQAKKKGPLLISGSTSLRSGLWTLRSNHA